jgi:hypothetical protein
MVNRKDVLAELGGVTDKLSTQVRTTAVAVLVLTWGLLIGDSPIARTISTERKSSLILLGVASVTILFLDFLQYFAGYFSTMKVLNEMERAKTDEGQYDDESLPWRLRLSLFWAKQALLVLTVIAFLVVFGCWAVSK